MIDRLRGTLPTVLLASALLAAAACKENLYTEPPYLYNVIGVSARFRSATGAATLISFQSFLDGVPLEPIRAAAGPISDTPVGGSLDELAVGPHDFSVRVVSQTASPSPYILSDIKVSRLNRSDGQVIGQRAWMVEVPATLADGESVTYRVVW